MFTTLGLSLRSVRQRPGRFLATLLSAFLGATIIMTFNSMHDTAAGDGVDKVSADTLTTAASVVGGYGTLLVFFAIASTLTVNVRQRDDEINLLRNTGATPGQIKRMVVGEAVVVALAGALLAIGPAVLGGAVLLDVFKDSGQVADSVDHSFGPIALMSGIDVTLLAAAGAAFLAVRRATRAAAGVRQGPGRARKFLSWAALALGGAAVCSTYAMKPTDAALMAAPAYGAILLSVGLAVVSTGLLRAALGRVEPLLTALTGASGYLTVRNMRQRASQLSGVLVPLILFTGMATATLYMQAVENDAIKASGLTKSIEDKNLETLNLTVVGIIVVFACVMLINSLYAATAYRVREFGQQRLAGATPAQVLGTVAVEGVVLTVTGVFFGTLAALAGILPFTAVRTDGLLPERGLGIWITVVAIAAAATMVTSLVTAWRGVRVPAVDAVALAA
ncbi:FtsX-like permease family protein [Streptomyces sp. SID8379]|uniref:FtsX-like permease family protein n=1 Tax=unclassified Streptomyces TaxID=2593676 RepID=UPI00037C204A|nr:MULTISPECIES: FtsX-like permease family protein [unclassified Streptomyces]MYW64012.1 FtsX-like permease family protein [Streptomyces sp. SID8379]